MEAADRKERIYLKRRLAAALLAAALSLGLATGAGAMNMEIEAQDAQGRWIITFTDMDPERSEWVRDCAPDGALVWVPRGTESSAQALLSRIDARKGEVESRFGIRVSDERAGEGTATHLRQYYDLEEYLEAIPAPLYEAVRAQLSGQGKVLTVRLVAGEGWNFGNEPNGSYDPQSTTIRLMSPDTFVFAHEYGHMVHTLLDEIYGPGALQARWTALNAGAGYGSRGEEGVFVTDYAATSYREDFAETFAVLLARHDRALDLMAQAPSGPAAQKLELMRQLLQEAYGLDSSALPTLALSQPSGWAAAGVAAYSQLCPDSVLAEPDPAVPFYPGYQSPATREDFAQGAYELVEACWSALHGENGSSYWQANYPDLPQDHRGLMDGRPFGDIHYGSGDLDKNVAIMRLYHMGVVTGVDASHFRPEGTITRQEAAVMLARLCRALGHDLPADGPAPADAGQCAGGALEDIRAVMAAGIMDGVGEGRFDPLAPYTYEQSAVTMASVYQWILGAA